VPQGFDWPFVPNPDKRPEFCAEHYGWLGSTDLIVDFAITILPEETKFARVPKPGTTIPRDCVKKGTYLFYSSVNDNFHYPEYFNADYFWADTLPHPQAYNQLNKTLLKKRELFRPAVVHIIN
jgi:hypothetical protein